MHQQQSSSPPPSTSPPRSYSISHQPSSRQGSISCTSLQMSKVASHENSPPIPPFMSASTLHCYCPLCQHLQKTHLTSNKLHTDPPAAGTRGHQLQNPFSLHRDPLIGTLLFLCPYFVPVLCRIADPTSLPAPFHRRTQRAMQEKNSHKSNESCGNVLFHSMHL